MRNTVITKVDQDSLTPDAVLNDLMEGNQRFIDNNLTATDHTALVQQTIGGQFPKAAILSSKYSSRRSSFNNEGVP